MSDDGAVEFPPGAADEPHVTDVVYSAEVKEEASATDRADATVHRLEAISIGTATLANRDSILIQSTSIQFLLEGAIARAKREGSNSTDIPALQNILAAVVDLHQMVMVTMVPEAIVGAKAISVKDKLIDWWDSDHASILDRGFNMGLFAAGLGLCALAGVVPAVVVATLIRGKEIGEALKEVAKILAGQNTKE